MDWRNAKMTPEGTIVCEVSVSGGFWFPFHATPDDPEEYGAALFHEIREVINAADS